MLYPYHGTLYRTQEKTPNGDVRPHTTRTSRILLRPGSLSCTLNEQWNSIS
jgi:hypothetical protein